MHRLTVSGGPWLVHYHGQPYEVVMKMNLIVKVHLAQGHLVTRRTVRKLQQQLKERVEASELYDCNL